MDKYIPKFGETVEVSFVGKVEGIEKNAWGEPCVTLSIKVKADGSERLVGRIPLQVVAPFDAEAAKAELSHEADLETHEKGEMAA